MAEPSSFRVNGIWAGGDVAGSITLTNTAATLGWADAYFVRNAAGIIQAVTTAGADTATLRANKHRMTNGSTWRDEADAQADLTNAAGTTGMRFDVGNVPGRLILRTIGGSATGASFQAGNVITAALTFATLPGTPVQGMRAFITDGSTATFGATVAGGGANAVPVVYDGTNWIVG